MSDNRKVAGKLIGMAAETVLKNRPGVHGSAENSFLMIGQMWTVYLRHAKSVRGSDEVLPQDVAQMMSMLKKARAMYGDVNNDDNFVDDIGYTSLAGMLQLPDPEMLDKTTEQLEREISASADELEREHLRTMTGTSAIRTKHTGINS